MDPSSLSVAEVSSPLPHYSTLVSSNVSPSLLMSLKTAAQVQGTASSCSGLQSLAANCRSSAEFCIQWTDPNTNQTLCELIKTKQSCRSASDMDTS